MSFNKYQNKNYNNSKYEDRRYERNDEPIVKCKFCDEDIWWRTTKAGKFQPISFISGACNIDECTKRPEKGNK